MASGAAPTVPKAAAKYTPTGAQLIYTAVLAVIGGLAWWARRRFTGRQQPTDHSGTV